MNIKSFLLGSATALTIVSGADAADAIVAAAPEPMEYVKVCDAFGTGYFYIPGTETCLKISGFVRWQLGYGSRGAVPTSSTVNPGYRWTSYNSNSQFRLDVSAKNDSEIGTVYSWIELRGSDNSVSGTGVNTGSTYNGVRTYYYAGVDAGVAGFEVGYYDSYWSRFFDIAGLGKGGFTDDGGSYRLLQDSYAAFYGKSGNISYMASVDDLTSATTNTAFPAGKTAGINAAVKGTFDNFGAALGVDYDIAAKSFGMKGYVSAKFSPVMIKIMGLYAQNASNIYAPAAGFTLITAGRVDITSKLFAAVDYSYSFTPKTWNVVGDLGWTVANGFAVLGEVKYASTKVTSGFLRFQRTF
jgi:hypothetical protein